MSATTLAKCRSPMGDTGMFAAFAALLSALLSAACGAPSVAPVSGVRFERAAAGTADLKFEPEQAASVRRSVESKGWVYIDTTVRLVRTGGASEGQRFEEMNFIDAATIERQGAQARVRFLASFAAPLPGSLSALSSFVTMHQIDCAARTHKVLWVEGYGDAFGDQRVGSRHDGRAEPAAVLPNTFGDDMVSQVCTGRFAHRGRSGA